MPGNTATILIPDISGYTEFMSTTELEHSSHVINYLLDSIVQTLGEEYEVSEIEGDAVLIYRRGDAPSKKDVVEICMKMFNAFHYTRKWIQQVAICPCGACQAIINLRLKFVVHFGAVSEIKVSRFSKLSGVDLIIAHRLLKNSIGADEYLLLTEKLLLQEPDKSESLELEWSSSADEFSAIGKVKYDFALLENFRQNIPGPPNLENRYCSDSSPYIEKHAEVNYIDLHINLSHIPGRASWMRGLKSTEQNFHRAYVGSIHKCIFDNYTALVSPLKMTHTLEGIVYAESCQIEKMDIYVVYEYVFKPVTDHSCIIGYRIMPAGAAIPEDLKLMLYNDLNESILNLIQVCEAMRN